MQAGHMSTAANPICARPASPGVSKYPSTAAARPTVGHEQHTALRRRQVVDDGHVLVPPLKRRLDHPDRRPARPRIPSPAARRTGARVRRAASSSRTLSYPNRERLREASDGVAVAVRQRAARLNRGLSSMRMATTLRAGHRQPGDSGR